MDKKSKALLIIIVIAAISSLTYTYNKTVIRNDFERVSTEELEEGAEGSIVIEEQGVDIQVE